MRKQLLKLFVLLAIMSSGCTMDLTTKDLVNEQLKQQSIPVIKNYLNITYVENHAIAFGLFENLDRSIRMPIIFLLPLLATLPGIYFIWKFRYEKFRLLLPVFILLGGAYGNIIDRAMNGYVTDFLHIHYFDRFDFYVFNIADMLVNIGVLLILFQYREFRGLLNNLFTRNPDIKPG